MFHAQQQGGIGLATGLRLAGEGAGQLPGLVETTRLQPFADRLFALTTQGASSMYEAYFLPGDWLVFGSETKGLAPEVRAAFGAGQRLKVPMLPGQRSLNLSNTVAVTVFEAWRQNGFANAALPG